MTVVPTERREEGIVLGLAPASTITEGVELPIDQAALEQVRRQLDALDEARRRAERESRDLYID